jgi:hypothetical protein
MFRGGFRGADGKFGQFRPVATLNRLFFPLLPTAQHLAHGNHRSLYVDNSDVAVSQESSLAPIKVG